jgi:hypothetical protein
MRTDFLKILNTPQIFSIPEKLIPYLYARGATENILPGILANKCKLKE